MISELTLVEYQRNVHCDQFNAEIKRLANQRLMQSTDFVSANKENLDSMADEEKKNAIAREAFKQPTVEKGSFSYFLFIRSPFIRLIFSYGTAQEAPAV